MAIGTTLPPRAYTREILTAAFNWLQTQPDTVRTKATTPDALVGLYTRAQRFGSVAEADAPVSSQNFMSDLKNLAEGLKAFDGSKVQFSPAEAAISGPNLNVGTKSATPLSAAPSAVVPGPQAPTQMQIPLQANPKAASYPPPQAAVPDRATLAASMTSTAASTAAPLHEPAAFTASASATASVASPAAMSPVSLDGLNERAVAMLQEVQTALNLSSESEAANMMIALAYKTLKASLL